MGMQHNKWEERDEGANSHRQGLHGQGMKLWEHQLAENAAEITFENLQSHRQIGAG